jgi:hypothetical protein
LTSAKGELRRISGTSHHRASDQLVSLSKKINFCQCKSIEEPTDIPHLLSGMTYKDFYAQAMLSSLPIAYAVERDLVHGREPSPEDVALGASQLAMALTELLARTADNVPGANAQF